MNLVQQISLSILLFVFWCFIFWQAMFWFSFSYIILWGSEGVRGGWCTIAFFFFFFSIFGLPAAYEVPRPGIRSELQLWPMPQLWQLTAPGQGSVLCLGTAETAPIPLCHSGNCLMYLFFLFKFPWNFLFDQ